MLHTNLIRRAVFAAILSGTVFAASAAEARPARRSTTKHKPAPRKAAPKKITAKTTAPRATTRNNAVVSVETYREQSRQNAVEWVKQAAEAFERGDYKGTIALCKSANDAYPTYSRAYTWMGAAYQKLGNTEEACSAFKWVVALSPNTPDAERAQRGLKEMGYYNPTF